VRDARLRAHTFPCLAWRGSWPYDETLGGRKHLGTFGKAELGTRRTCAVRSKARGSTDCWCLVPCALVLYGLGCRMFKSKSKFMMVCLVLLAKLCVGALVMFRLVRFAALLCSLAKTPCVARCVIFPT
jgi:hypothetical protein